jgi:hypothetical protein
MRARSRTPRNAASTFPSVPRPSRRSRSTSPQHDHTT